MRRSFIWVFVVGLVALTACPEGPTEAEHCVVHTDCTPGQWCHAGTCEVGTLCSTDNDCSADSNCINAVCVNQPHDAGLSFVDAATNDSASVDAGPGQDAHVATCGLSLIPDPVEFGALRVGAVITRELELRNDNEIDMQVLNVSIVGNSANNEFSVDTANSFVSGPLAAGQSRTVSVTYTPVDALPDNASLQVLATGCETNTYSAALVAEFKQSPEIVVSDGPSDAAQPITSVDFGEVRVGQFAQAQIYIKNVHPESGLMIDQVSLQPVSDGTFVVAQNFLLPATLSQWVSSCIDNNGCDSSAGQRCEDGACVNALGQYIDQLVVTLQFLPGLEQDFNAQLRINSTDAERSPTVLTLLGTGLPAHDCPDRSNAPGHWDSSANTCIWACEDGWFDLNQDLALSVGSDGCEYQCSFQDGVYDDPDMAFVDANCDGMDGVIEDGWFVSRSAGSCSGSSCGSKLYPFNTLAAAINAASSDPDRKNIYVSDEVYSPSQTLQLTPGLRIYGGYRVLGIAPNLQWRDRQGATTINGASPALFVSGATQHTLLQNLVLQAAAGSPTQPSSICAVVVNSPDLMLEAMILQASDGLSGVDGAVASAGATGSDGTLGFDGCDFDTGSASCFLGGAGGAQTQCGLASGGRGGNGGMAYYSPDSYDFSLDGADDPISSSKYGGATLIADSKQFSVSSAIFTGDHVGQFIAFSTSVCDSASIVCRRITRLINGTTVELGLEEGLADASYGAWSMQINDGAESGGGAALSIYGGAGGTAQNTCDSSAIPPTSKSCCGNNGGDGDDGQHGNPGSSGAALAGFWDGQSWQVGTGSAGGAGVGDASGGQGGGGGGGGDCSIGFGDYSCFDLNDPCVSDRGGGGGGGGAAGCPGSGGQAGGGGGASIGLIAINSPLQLVGGQLGTGNGGDGGAGAAGGAGGLGGDGAAGGQGVERAGNGGAGGAGGRGGFGGGGAGGSGGDVFGIAFSGTAPSQAGGFALELGEPGAAGLGGQGAAAGFCRRDNASVCGQGQDGLAGRAVANFALP